MVEGGEGGSMDRLEIICGLRRNRRYSGVLLGEGGKWVDKVGIEMCYQVRMWYICIECCKGKVCRCPIRTYSGGVNEHIIWHL